MAAQCPFKKVLGKPIFSFPPGEDIAKRPHSYGYETVPARSVGSVILDSQLPELQEMNCCSSWYYVVAGYCTGGPLRFLHFVNAAALFSCWKQ